MRHYHVELMSYERPEPHHKLVAQYELVTLQQRAKNRFAVRYGSEVHDGLTYAQACTKLGEALMHQAACDGLLDNRMPGERD
jgi:hypothetical protein